MTFKDCMEWGESILMTVSAKTTNESARIARSYDAYLRSCIVFLRHKRVKNSRTGPYFRSMVSKALSINSTADSNPSSTK